MVNQPQQRPELKLLKELGLDDKLFAAEQQRIDEARELEQVRIARWRSDLSRLALNKEAGSLREILEIFVVQDVFDDNEKRMLLNEGQRSLAKYLLSLMEIKK